jgi:chemotaxis protein methyltransferase CheR/two-component system CheB/CheR fusion protein
MIRGDTSCSALLPLAVGVGASAGGLEAMLPMFARMRRTGRIAYVVAQHMMHNGHSDLVARLIGRESSLPVVVASSGIRLLADTIYLIPSGKDGWIRDGHLELSDPSSQNISTPSVNILFCSLAETQGAKAIGIVLSGAGSDGTAGCRAIKSKGGLTLAQDPTEAKFDGMPSAAIAAKLIDRVLRVDQVGETLANLFPGTPAAPPAKLIPIPRTTPGAGRVVAVEPPVTESQHEELAWLMPRILEATGIDFSSYKEETLLRRLEKRKSVLGLLSASEYQALVGRQPGELRTLQHLFLVSVSSFFRDRESFRVLERALASVLVNKSGGEPIRIWVPGCASGEECYSLAIVVFEILRELHRRYAVAITGTDLNPEALEMAAKGVYRLTAFKEMDNDFHSRYFLRAGQHLSVKPEVKSCVTFERRDVFTGPPPTDLDLVSCRNLLIYLKGPLQDQLLRIFCQALRPDGLLFMGQSESLSFAGHTLFATVDYQQRLFRRRDRDARTLST